MLDRKWTTKEVFDLCKLGCAAALFASPWMLGLAGRPAWNLWVCGYAMVTIALADLTAEADWEPRTSLYLGVWLLTAPWILGFSQDVAATLVHLAGGGIASLLSAAELWSTEHTPPQRFQPGAARHADTLPAIDDVDSQGMLHAVGGVAPAPRAHIPRHHRVHGSRPLTGWPRRADVKIGERWVRRGWRVRRAPDCYPVKATRAPLLVRYRNHLPCRLQEADQHVRSLAGKLIEAEMTTQLDNQFVPRRASS
jgi:SPW repeat